MSRLAIASLILALIASPYSFDIGSFRVIAIRMIALALAAMLAIVSMVRIWQSHRTRHGILLALLALIISTAWLLLALALFMSLAGGH